MKTNIKYTVFLNNKTPITIPKMYNSFGSVLQGRSWSEDGVSKYKYGMNGQEKEDDVAGADNIYSAEYWMYDSRLGRRFNVDPKLIYSISSYCCFGNSPINNKDIYGDTFDPTNGSDKKADETKSKVEELLVDVNKELKKSDKKISDLENKLKKHPNKESLLNKLEKEQNNRRELVFKKAQFEDAICEINQMASDKMVFSFQQSYAGSSPRTFYDNGKIIMSVDLSSISEITHELKHCSQYIDGLLSFNSLKTVAGYLLDQGDEIQALQRQYAFNNIVGTAFDNFSSYTEINYESLKTFNNGSYIVLPNANLTIYSTCKFIIDSWYTSGAKINVALEYSEKYLEKPYSQYYKKHKANSYEIANIPK